MSRVMGRAGVAITITSVTDFVAFGIGASTVLPTLRSFCVFAAVGIMVIFFFQVCKRHPSCIHQVDQLP